jgi:hypothetical protein
MRYRTDQRTISTNLQTSLYTITVSMEARRSEHAGFQI